MILSTEQELDLRRHLFELRQEHRLLDQQISELVHDPDCDQFMLTRLKRRKLQLKDAIQRISSQLIPDLDA
ncbi:MAG: hypothetical protein CR991_06145 [Proteobacteria bacterium]|nr:MAG: hypothetical protein CR991_06145 [Pseudomonadota bacterium]